MVIAPLQAGLYKDEFIICRSAKFNYYYRDNGYAEATVVSPSFTFR